MRRLVALSLVALASAPLGCGPAPAPTSAIEAVRDAGLCGRLEDASALLTPLLEQHADDPAVALLAGDVAAWHDDDDEALRHFARAAALAPDDPQPHLHSAYVLLVRGAPGAETPAAARHQLDEALRDTQGIETAAILACRGELAWVEGQPDAAEQHFRSALELAPDCAWALQRLVQILPTDAPEQPDLRARLERVRASEAHGEGMSRGRAPVTFCAD